MIEDRANWLQIATQISSFRQMYCLADAIAISAVATPIERRAAKRVVGSLRDVIDAPIAEAAVLARARKRFGSLVNSLRVAA